MMPQVLKLTRSCVTPVVCLSTRNDCIKTCRIKFCQQQSFVKIIVARQVLCMIAAKAFSAQVFGLRLLLKRFFSSK